MMKAMPTRSSQRNKPSVNIPFNGWNAGYMSYTEAIRARRDCFTDMTNMDLVEDGIPMVRPGTTKYGAQPLGTVIGVGTFIKAAAGATPISYQITMQVIGSVGQILYNIDGGAWSNAGGAFDTSAWTTFTQSNNRVYISNGKNKMSYFDIMTGTIVSYNAIAAPAAPTVVASTALTGSSVVTYRVRISANNNVGETQAGLATLITVSEYRDSWNPTTQSLTITWPQVTGAASYNVYFGTIAGEEMYLGNVPQPSAAGDVKFVDNNRGAINPYKKAPNGNSTEGPIVTSLQASSDGLFGTGDITNRYRVWYSAAGDKSGNFSPFEGGGWVDINYGGDSIPVVAKPFRDGQGKYAVTILTKGSAGSGDFYHLTFVDQQIGNYTITYPDIKRANGQSGTYSSMAVVEANNALYYPTGKSIKTTGTKPSMINILVTSNITDTIQPDVNSINLAALHKAVGLNINGRIAWCLPVGSNKNNEIWIYDYTRNGAWILRWTLPCEYMWKYEDTSGQTHWCILTNNKILEFNESAIDDDGVPFKTRLALPTITFDKSALQMASIDIVRWLLLRPQGSINTNIYGLGENNESMSMLVAKKINPIVDPTGWDVIEYDTNEYGYALPPSAKKSKGQQPIMAEIGETVSQLTIDFTTDGNAKYLLNSVLVTGKKIPNLYQGDR